MSYIYKTNLISSGIPESMAVNVLYHRVPGNTITYTYVYFCDTSDHNISSRLGMTVNTLATAICIPTVFLMKSTLDYWNSFVNKHGNKTYISQHV